MNVLLETACGCRKLMAVPDNQGMSIDVGMIHVDPWKLVGPEEIDPSRVMFSKRTFEYMGETLKKWGSPPIYIYCEVLR